MMSATVWITFANVLYLASYAVHDILWLRMLTVVAAGLLIPYYLMQPVPLTAAVWWNAVFIAINVYWIVRLIYQRRPVHFTADEALLRDLAFGSLSAREARQLFAMGVWIDMTPGESIVQRDKTTGRFSVILRGTANVVHGSVKITEFGAGQFVGTIDRLSGEETYLDVLVRESVRCMCWPQSQLQTYLARRPDVALALERSVGLEIRRLLDTTLAEITSN